MRKAMMVLFMSLFMGVTVYGGEVDGYGLLVDSLNNVGNSDVQEEVELGSEDSLVSEGLDIIERIENGIALESDYVQLNTILVELKKVQDNSVLKKDLMLAPANNEIPENEILNGGCYNCGLHTYVLQYGMDAYCNYRLYNICESCIN